jgi:sugar (pentulose or hexulose) kinase
MGILIGLDVGTTNTKAVAFDPASGQVVAGAVRPTPYVSVDGPSGAPGGEPTREIDPEALWQAVSACLRELTAHVDGSVLALGIASMAEAGLPLDAVGQPLYRIIPWYDFRTEPQLHQILAQVDPLHLFRVTGQAHRHVYTLFKVLWLRAHAPRAFAALHRWLSVADYVAWRLAGVTATDVTLASRTMFFDQRTRAWSPEMLALAGLRAEQLPTVAASGATVGQVSAAAAAATGLPPAVPVGIGGHDHLCAALAVGAVRPGDAVDSIGTAESLVVSVPTFRDDDQLGRSRTCCYAHVLPGQYAVQSGLAMGGGALEWLADLLYRDAPDPVAAALAEAGSAPPGAGGLFYFPYLGGNGAPVGDENVTGGFVGLRPTQDRRYLVRALLEGIAFGIRDGLENLRAVIGEVRSPLRAVGGGSRSPLWLQLRANVLGLPVAAVDVPEAVALGAGLLAGVGAGVYPSVDAAAEAVQRHSTTYQPDLAVQSFYNRRYWDGYRHLYPNLAPAFAALAKLESG